ncbi:MAG: NAD(P)/FAD-dependent oxidoreductase [Bacteroidales bacterium]|nr:NAD(P)/FAD-dependent oxidoreductase [Bacteroidales bacterium]
MKINSKIIIAGGGISGLATAASLAKKGAKVLLIEKNEKTGGLVNSFIKDGFLFDGGVRAVENAGMIKPMLEELEIDLPLYKSDVSVGVENFVIGAERKESVDDYEQMLKKLYPESGKEVERVINVIRKYDKYMNVLFGNESPFFKDAKRDRTYWFTTFIVWIFRLIATTIAVLRMRMPVEDFLHRIIKNESLIDIIDQHFFRGTPAFFAMSYFSLYTDYYYPEGGVGKIPEKLEEKIITMGGEVLKNTLITRVNLKEKSITDANGVNYSYDKLIWAADLKYLYTIIDKEGLSRKILSGIDKEQERFLSKKGAESVFTVFMGVDQPPEIFRAISHGHFFYTPSKEGLGSLHREDLKKMLENWEHISKESILEWLERFCRLNTYEISIPVLNDPNAAPEGKTGIIASFLFDYELIKRIEKEGWYEEFKLAVEEKIPAVLSESIYPGLNKHIIFKFSASPLTLQKWSGSSEGAIVGWSFEEPVPLKSSILNMKDSVKTALPDVYKAGQWSASPAGIPTCILTSKLAADLVYRELSAQEKQQNNT